MTIWKAGMLAVCIDDRPHPIWGKDDQLVKGRVYRVEGVPRHGYCPAFDAEMSSLLLAGIRAASRTGDYGCARFRPIVKADDAFIEQMRALKPLPATPELTNAHIGREG